MKILFVDRANNERSAMAEAFCNSMAKGKHTATSAGLSPESKTASEAAQRAMHEKNLDLSSHKPRKVMQKTINDADLVVFLDLSVRDHAEEHLSVTEDKSQVWFIEVTWEHRGDERKYNQIRDSIEHQVGRLLEAIDKGISRGRNRGRRRPLSKSAEGETKEPRGITKTTRGPPDSSVSGNWDRVKGRMIGPTSKESEMEPVEEWESRYNQGKSPFAWGMTSQLGRTWSCWTPSGWRLEIECWSGNAPTPAADPRGEWEWWIAAPPGSLSAGSLRRVRGYLTAMIQAESWFVQYGAWADFSAKWEPLDPGIYRKKG